MNTWKHWTEKEWDALPRLPYTQRHSGDTWIAGFEIFKKYGENEGVEVYCSHEIAFIGPSGAYGCESAISDEDAKTLYLNGFFWNAAEGSWARRT